MGLWLRVEGEVYDFEAIGGRIPTIHYIELEEQSKITLEQMTTRGELSLLRSLAAWAFLIRRNNGEAVTYRKAAAEIAPDDFLSYGDSPDAAPPVAPQDGAQDQVDDATPSPSVSVDSAIT